MHHHNSYRRLPGVHQGQLVRRFVCIVIPVSEHSSTRTALPETDINFQRHRARTRGLQHMEITQRHQDRGPSRYSTCGSTRARSARSGGSEESSQVETGCRLLMGLNIYLTGRVDQIFCHGYWKICLLRRPCVICMGPFVYMCLLLALYPNPLERFSQRILPGPMHF